MDRRRSKRNVLRATLAAGVLFLTALFATQSSRMADCAMPPEPPRALDLSQPADRQHLDADLSLIVRTATRYRQSFGDTPSASSIHAAATAKSRPDRAYRYCVAVLTTRMAEGHHLDPATLTH